MCFLDPCVSTPRSKLAAVPQGSGRGVIVDAEHPVQRILHLIQQHLEPPEPPLPAVAGVHLSVLRP